MLPFLDQALRISSLGFILNEERSRVREQARIHQMNISTTQAINVIAEDQATKDVCTPSFQSRPLDSSLFSSYRCVLNEVSPYLCWHGRDREGMREYMLASKDTDVGLKDERQKSIFDYSSIGSRPNDSMNSSLCRYTSNGEDPDLNYPSLNNWKQGLELFQQERSSDSNMNTDGQEEHFSKHQASLNNWKQGLELFHQRRSLNSNITTGLVNYLDILNDWKTGLELFRVKRISESNNFTKDNHNKYSSKEHESKGNLVSYEQCHITPPELSRTLDTVHMIPSPVQHLMIDNTCNELHKRAKGLQNRVCKNILEESKNVPTHTVEARFVCHMCGKSFEWKKGLAKHLGIHHPERLFSCDKCQKKFVCKDYLKKHHMAVHKGAQFKCDKCPKQFCYKSTLKTHMVVHEDARFKCDKCPKQFHYKCNMKAHIVAHEGAQFKCDKCPKQFHFESNLKRHDMVVHEGARFKCDKCPKQFRHQHNLKAHMVRHESPQFKCDKCQKQFHFESNLKRHDMVVHEGAQFKCDKCPKQFHYKCHLKEHNMVVHEGAQFKCDKCPKQFHYKRNLKAHMQFIKVPYSSVTNV